ncbi:Laminin subunit alpha-5 [Saguinus oedipus]|uniref:Laminin subunit alpha-5 n=1 Tax=Saguinus oedipus TaxID=9490 RepID=A0ABQ9VLN4_SAGOE|nr:Laminin subunit alpha-5 [Saguinus oedipus]
MGHLGLGNASAPSGEHLRRTLAEVERLLQEMQARDLGAPRSAAEAELAAAQRLLARVQEQLRSLWEENWELATRTQDWLAQHEAGLMDLREALNQAVDATREAQELNSHNQERLEEALQRKQELSQDNATLRATLNAARDTLASVFGLLHSLDQAKEELERLAASLDGARTPLLQRMQAFSPAGSKLHLVEAAEAHALQLGQLALNLSSSILDINQDRLTQRAIEASSAYSRILQAVQAAEDAAGEALQQADHTWAVRPYLPHNSSKSASPQPVPPVALACGLSHGVSLHPQTVVQQGLVGQARQLLANSSALEEAVLQEQRRLGLVWATLRGAGTQLRDVRARKDQLEAHIQEVQAMLAMDTGTPLAASGPRGSLTVALVTRGWGALTVLPKTPPQWVAWVPARAADWAIGEAGPLGSPAGLDVLWAEVEVELGGLWLRWL